jgi:hypothetical protein
MNQLQRIIAFLLSFRKRDWSVGDYPIHYRRQSTEPTRVRGELVCAKPWIAQIPGWWSMIGTGDTREEARLALQRCIEDYRESAGSLPRPGTSLPIQFAPFVFMSRNEDLAREFFPPILDVDYDDCLITDQSSVWDFPVDFTADELARKVLLTFGTDIRDLAEEGNLAAILDRIAAHRGGVET